jgi:hypothetical protein
MDYSGSCKQRYGRAIIRNTRSFGADDEAGIVLEDPDRSESGAAGLQTLVKAGDQCEPRGWQKQ